MDKLKMQSENLVDKNIEKIEKLFPNCVTEGKDENGKVFKAIDFDLLKQELSKVVVDGTDERYTLNWAGKKQSILTANSPINATLRPCREESVDFDNTKNLYIEGDNLDVLKLLRETYLNKIKMIYIDPPYNTGNDFVYNDDFASSADEYLQNSKSYDEDGNRMVQNLESNGRFHSDWLSMMYPRLKLARDLLTENGCICISLDDNEQSNIIKLCCEIFGEKNFIAQIPILSNPRGRQSSEFVAQTHEYISIFAKNREKCVIRGEDLTESQKNEYNLSDNKGNYRLLGLRLRGGRATAEESPTLHFPIFYNIKEDDFYLERKYDDDYEIIPKFEDGTLGTWRWSKAKILAQKDELVVKPVKDRYDVFQKDYLRDDKTMKLKSLWAEKEINYDNSARELKSLEMGDVFDYAKPLYLLKKILKTICGNTGLVLDFFSGSATTAHAVMQLNTEDGGNRKFIMVQLPEKCDEKSEAYKAGYKNICEIGKERIRRAGQKIIEDGKLGHIDIDKNKLMQRTFIEEENKFEDKYALKTTPAISKDILKNLDIGFRVLKLDSSNMKDVYYSPSDTEQTNLLDLVSNIKEDRSPEDLLFQVMLDMGVMLSSDIKTLDIKGKKVFNVNDGNLVCCFDENLTDEVVTEIAKMQPLYAVFRDSSMSSDSVAVNFDQIFETYSPSTTRKVI